MKIEQTAADLSALMGLFALEREEEDTKRVKRRGIKTIKKRNKGRSRERESKKEKDN